MLESGRTISNLRLWHLQCAVGPFVTTGTRHLADVRLLLSQVLEAVDVVTQAVEDARPLLLRSIELADQVRCGTRATGYVNTIHGVFWEHCSSPAMQPRIKVLPSALLSAHRCMLRSQFAKLRNYAPSCGKGDMVGNTELPLDRLTTKADCGAAHR